MGEYIFDSIAVATFTVITDDGPDKARSAAGNAAEFETGNGGGVECGDDDVTYELRAVTLYGRPAMVDADGDDVPDDLVPDAGLEDPLPPDARESLKDALNEADAALGGDSNDAEHDALYSVRETIAGILDVDYDAPEAADSVMHNEQDSSLA